MARRRSNSSGGYCSVCRHRYRGSWADHYATQTHKLNVARAESKSYDVGRKHRRTSAQLSIARERAEGERMVNVEEYFRNPPTPPWPARIRDRVLYVVHHWRRPPGTVSGSNRLVRGHRRRRARGKRR